MKWERCVWRPKLIGKTLRGKKKNKRKYEHDEANVVLLGIPYVPNSTCQ